MIENGNILRQRKEKNWLCGTQWIQNSKEWEIDVLVYMRFLWDKENTIRFKKAGKLGLPVSGAGNGPANGGSTAGAGIDIHSLIGKLPRPKGGWTPGKYKYMGPYNPLEKQLDYDPETGEVLKWHVQPYNKADEIAAHHDICYGMASAGKRTKGDCDRKMVRDLDSIPYGEMPKWGQTARFLINTKQKLGLGNGRRR